MTKRMTVIGKADSVHVKRFVEYIAMPLGYDTTIISDFNRRFVEYYSEKNVEVDAWGKGSFVAQIPKFRWLLYLCRVIKKIKKDTSDIIVIQYADQFLMRVLSIVHFNKPYIITYWGSDLYRSNSIILDGSSWAVEQALKIVVMTEDMKRRLIDVYGKEISTKVVVSDFGDATLGIIDKKCINANEARRAVLGDYCNKLSITVGYNAITAQQHEKVLEAFRRISENEKQNIVFVLPLSYPNNPQYIEKIKSLLDEYNFHYILLRDYMDEEQMADLYIATDIFINAQVSDALSFSMIEHIYSGSVVWNGSWLKYDLLEENGIYVRKFNSFAELSQAITSFNDDKANTDRNKSFRKKKLSECFSWNSCLERWDKILSEI